MEDEEFKIDVSETEGGDIIISVTKNDDAVLILIGDGHAKVAPGANCTFGDDFKECVDVAKRLLDSMAEQALKEQVDTEDTN